MYKALPKRSLLIIKALPMVKAIGRGFYAPNQQNNEKWNTVPTHDENNQQLTTSKASIMVTDVRWLLLPVGAAAASASK